MSQKITNKEKSKLRSTPKGGLVATKPFHKQPKKSVLLNIFKFMLKWGFVTFVWGATISSAWVLYYIHDLPDLNKLQTVTKQRKITILSDSGAVLTNYGDLYGEYVNFDQIPKILIDAVVATEDRRFFHHFGLDPIGLIRAAYTNYRAGHVVQGGSTITQQLAKIAFLKPERTLKRKIQELVLALYLESNLSKQQIITIYLNRVYLGSGIYGVDAAAKYYFGKKLGQLNLYEAAIIAGLLKAPSKYSPTNNIELAGKRAFQILLNMEDAGYINKHDIAMAKDNPVILETSALGSRKSLYFCDYITEQLDKIIDDQDSDLIIQTTLSVEMQERAEKIVKEHLEAEGKKLNISQGALLALSKDGEILAMVGGRNYKESPFNRAVQAQRQPGSAFKIYVYLAALEYQGLGVNYIVNDGPIKIKKWQPRNYTRQFLGDITMREAFAKSINTVSVKLSEQVGREKVIKMAEELGVTSKMEPHPSIALGSTEMNLLELTSSFAAINNYGYKTPAYGIREIKNDKGEILFKVQKEGQMSALSVQTVDNIKEMLRSAVEIGTGKSAKLDREITYGKTGTTQDYRDAWFIGFAGNITLGVWVGNDNNKPMKKVTGGGFPAIIWKEFMSGTKTSEPSLNELKEIYEEPLANDNKQDSLLDELNSILGR
jgi:penicillin-binding protein 1A